jgi:hypothetical protein
LSGKTHAPHWQLIQQLNDAMDVVSFTSYPFFDYSMPSQIPNNYFSEIKNYTSKPIMITETAWPSTNRIVSGGSEQAQVEYLKILLQRLNAMNVYALVWIFPHDPNTGVAGGFFDDNSLRKSDGTPKLAFTYWQQLKALPKR